ncbi:MAG: catalase [Erysipelotrichaceae bacterium]|nr:catalase [Erysipelotrichaceae bacterium]
MHNFFGHLKTINRHKLLVMKYCFRCGMIKQGLLHDLSKYSPTEFLAGVEFYQEGKRSPVGAEKMAKGYSLGWLHHKAHNKHHWLYWVDQGLPGQGIVVYKMPENYFLESLLDRMAASKNYSGADYTDWSTYEFFQKSEERHLMNPEDSERTSEMLKYLGENGEEKTLQMIAELYKKFKQDRK